MSCKFKMYMFKNIYIGVRYLEHKKFVSQQLQAIPKLTEQEVNCTHAINTLALLCCSIFHQKTSRRFNAFRAIFLLLFNFRCLFERNSTTYIIVVVVTRKLLSLHVEHKYANWKVVHFSFRESRQWYVHPDSEGSASIIEKNA